jgi:phage gp45-like
MAIKWRAIVGTFWLALSLGFLSLGAHADEVTVIGTVNDNYQIVVADQIYEVTNNSAGDDLVLNYVGRKVKLTGSIKEINGVIIITVKSFEILNDWPPNHHCGKDKEGMESHHSPK